LVRTEALRIKPGNTIAYNNLGIVMFLKRNTDEAVAHFREALRIKPDFAEAHNNLKRALAVQGKIK